MQKIKLSFLMVILSLSAGVSSVYAADLNFTDATTVSIGGHSYVITAGSVASEPMTLTATNLTVTVPNPGTFTFQSPNGFSLANNGSIAQACNGAVNSITITAGVGPVIITPNPVLIVCASGSTSSGGGGLITNYVPPIAIPITPIISAPVSPVVIQITPVPVVIIGCNNGIIGFSIVTGQSCANNSSPAVTTPSTGFVNPSETTGWQRFYNFGLTTLKFWSHGEGVKELQRFLNDKLNLGLVIDGRLGLKTIAVIKKWQKDHSLVADGLVGNKTKAMMNGEVGR
jgi:hypothetical protein